MENFEDLWKRAVTAGENALLDATYYSQQASALHFLRTAAKTPFSEARLEMMLGALHECVKQAKMMDSLHSVWLAYDIIGRAHRFVTMVERSLLHRIYMLDGPLQDLNSLGEEITQWKMNNAQAAKYFPPGWGKSDWDKSRWRGELAYADAVQQIAGNVAYHFLSELEDKYSSDTLTLEERTAYEMVGRSDAVVSLLVHIEEHFRKYPHMGHQWTSAGHAVMSMAAVYPEHSGALSPLDPIEDVK